MTRLLTMTPLVLAICGVSIAFLGWLTWENAGSKPIVLAWAALLSSFIYLVYNLNAELADKKTSSFFNATYRIDRDQNWIGQWAYFDTRFPERLFFEQAAGKGRDFAQLEKGNELAAPGQLAAQLANLSFLQMLLSYGGWGQDDVVQKVGIDEIRNRRFDPDAGCSRLLLSDINALVQKSGSVFADAKIMGWPETCLPPNAWIKVEPYRVTIESAIFSLVFEASPQGDQRGGPPKKPILNNFGILI